jgi:hypothetical protein
LEYFVLQAAYGTLSFNLFNTPIIDLFLEGTEVNWENFVAFCSDEAQSISAPNSRLQALMRKKPSRIFYTYFVLHRVAFASRRIRE